MALISSSKTTRTCASHMESFTLHQVHTNVVDMVLKKAWQKSQRKVLKGFQMMVKSNIQLSMFTVNCYQWDSFSPLEILMNRKPQSLLTSMPSTHSSRISETIRQNLCQRQHQHKKSQHTAKNEQDGMIPCIYGSKMLSCKSWWISSLMIKMTMEPGSCVEESVNGGAY